MYKNSLLTNTYAESKLQFYGDNPQKGYLLKAKKWNKLKANITYWNIEKSVDVIT